jgi:hypothetical protein
VEERPFMAACLKPLRAVQPLGLPEPFSLR